MSFRCVSAGCSTSQHGKWLCLLHLLNLTRYWADNMTRQSRETHRISVYQRLGSVIIVYLYEEDQNSYNHLRNPFLFSTSSAVREHIEDDPITNCSTWKARFSTAAWLTLETLWPSLGWCWRVKNGFMQPLYCKALSVKVHSDLSPILTQGAFRWALNLLWLVFSTHNCLFLLLWI